MTEQEQQALARAIIARNSGRDQFAGHVGLTYDSLTLERAEGHFVVGQELCNPLGIAHGGTYYTLMDQLTGMAVAMSGRVGVTLDCNVNYLRSARLGDTVRCAAESVHLGRSVAVYDAKCWDGAGTLLCTGTFHLFLLGPVEQVVEQGGQA